MLQIDSYMSGALEPVDTQLYSLLVESAPHVTKKPKPKKQKSPSPARVEVIPTTYAESSDMTPDASHTA